MSNLVNINTATGDARMHADVAPRFDQLRKDVLAASGVDFLAKCGDVLRDPTFKSKKDGVANRSWHKTGRALDYDQNSPALVIVSEVVGGKQFFRTYLKCKNQDGSAGQKIQVKEMRGYNVNAFCIDFTAMAEAAGFTRIPAWKGWQSHYNRKEFWHYQRPEGLTWDQAMQQIKGSPAPVVKSSGGLIGLNDRDSNTGGRVTLVQQRLNALGLLDAGEIDGIFGKFSLAAVQAFQKKEGLGADGVVGPSTAAKLEIAL